MSKFKTAFRLAGIVLMAAGAICLPAPNAVFDTGDLSWFHNWADRGAFTRYGFTLIVIGLVAFGLSFLARGELID